MSLITLTIQQSHTWKLILYLVSTSTGREGAKALHANKEKTCVMRTYSEVALVHTLYKQYLYVQCTYKAGRDERW